MAIIQNKGEKIPEEARGSPQPPSRYTYGINLKLLCCFVLMLLLSQTWVFTSPECMPTHSLLGERAKIESLLKHELQSRALYYQMSNIYWSNGTGIYKAD